MPAPHRSDGRLTIALISDTFWEADGEGRLADYLERAAARGADLAVLPELPLNRWSPASRDPQDDDAEEDDGPRALILAAAAGAARIGLLGGVIHRETATGRRTSRALLYDSAGTLVATYDKLHLPQEPGFWEADHYEPGDAPPRVTDAIGVPLGMQLCSDINRPEGCHLLGAQGAVAILAPRATEERTYQRWKPVLRANAITSAAYLLTVNRPAPEHGVLIGGPSVAFDPTGELLVETTDPLALVTVGAAVAAAARAAYPGYLPVRARLYADAWSDIAGRDG